MSKQLTVIIDDERTFTSDSFDDAIYARNSRDALGILSKIWVSQYDQYGDSIFRLYLDHDLGEQPGDFDEGTYLDDTSVVVEYLVMLAQTEFPLRITEVCVHSQNPTSERFVMALKKYYSVSRIQLPECVSGV